MKKRNTGVKRWMAMVISLIMVVSLSIPVFAENEENNPGDNAELAEFQNKPETSDSLPVLVQQSENNKKEAELVQPGDALETQNSDADPNQVKEPGQSSLENVAPETKKPEEEKPEDGDVVKDLKEEEPKEFTENEQNCTEDEACQAEEHLEGCPKGTSEKSAWEAVQELIHALPEAETVAVWMESPEEYEEELTELQQIVEAIEAGMEALTMEEYARLDLTKLTALMEGMEVLAEEPEDTAATAGEMTGGEFLARAKDGVITLTGDVTLTESENQTTITVGKDEVTAAARIVEPLKINLDGYTLNLGAQSIYVAESGDLTVTGNGSVVNSQKRMFTVAEGGNLLIENGTFTTDKSWIICCMGTAVVADGSFTCTGYVQADSILRVDGSNARLTVEKGVFTAMAGGTNLKSNGGEGYTGTGYDGMYGIGVFSDGTLILGKEGSAEGPKITTVYAAVAMNNTIAPGTITIYGGTYTSTCSLKNDAKKWERCNAPLMLSAQANVTIKGGTFIAQKGGNADEGSETYAISVPYKNTGINLKIEGGTFESTGTTIYTPDYTGKGTDGQESGTRTILVSGGIYNNKFSEEYCMEGYALVDNGDGTYSVKVAENQTVFAAKIGETGYSTLQKALDAASKNGGEVVLLQNIDLGNSYAIVRGKTTLNLNEKLIEGTGEYVLAVLGEDVTIKNGHILGCGNKTSASVYAQNASMTIDSVKIENTAADSTMSHAGITLGNGSGKGYYGSAVILNSWISSSGINGVGVAVIGKEVDGDYKSKLQVRDSEISGTLYGISGNGATDGTIITLDSGAKVKSVGTTVGAGIYHPQQGILTINSGTEVEGLVGIQICGGNAVINEGSNIRSTDTERREGPFKDSKYADGSVLDGAALSVVSRASYGDVSVTVNGGRFMCANTANDTVKLYGFGKVDGSWVLLDELPTNAQIFITGGTFSKNVPAEYCAEGYVSVANGDGTYTVRIPASTPTPAPGTPAAPASGSGGGSRSSGRSGGSGSTPAPEAAPVPVAAAPVVRPQAPVDGTEEAEATEELAEIAENETPLASGEPEELTKIEDDEIPLFAPQLMAARGGNALNIVFILLLVGALCGGAAWYIIVMKKRQAEEE